MPTKKGSFPYFVHPRGVAYIVMEHNGTIDQINAALAHDLLEDTETSFLEIATVGNSMHVAELCSELRNNKFSIAEIGKEKYLEEKLMRMSSDALLIKLADMLYNSVDSPTEQAALRMMSNAKSVILKRRDVTEDHIQLAKLVFCS